MIASEGLPVEVACRVLSVSCAGFYAWRFRATLSKDDTSRVADRRDPRDPRSVIRQLRREARACRACARPRHLRWPQRGRDADAARQHRRPQGPASVAGVPGAPTADDLVDRIFIRGRPNQLWVTDITEHPIREGKVYWAVVLDAFSRRVVGWSI